MDKQNSTDLSKHSTEQMIVEIIEYVPDIMVSKTIVTKTSGKITVSSFVEVGEFAVKTTPFDTYIQIIDGNTEISINEKTYTLVVGDGIMIPANAVHCINPNSEFKMISTVITRWDE